MTHKPRHIFLIGARASGKSTVGRALAALLGCRWVDTDSALTARLGMSVADFVAAQGWDAFRAEESRTLREVCALGTSAAPVAGLSPNSSPSGGGSAPTTSAGASVQTPLGASAYLGAAGTTGTAGSHILVVATGGGMVLAEANRVFMREGGTVVYLQASVPVMVARLQAEPLAAQRPSLTAQSSARTAPSPSCTGDSLTDEVTDVLRTRAPLYMAAAHFTVDATLPPEVLAAQIKQYCGL